MTGPSQLSDHKVTAEQENIVSDATPRPVFVCLLSAHLNQGIAFLIGAHPMPDSWTPPSTAALDCGLNNVPLSPVLAPTGPHFPSNAAVLLV